MCEFCERLRQILMDPKFRVALERDRDIQFNNYIYRRSAVEPALCFGELEIINETLYLNGDDYDCVFTKLNYCPECGESLEWAKNKVAESIEKNVPAEYRGEDYYRLVARDTFEADLKRANLRFNAYMEENGIDKYYFDNYKYRVEIYKDGRSMLIDNETDKEMFKTYNINQSVVSHIVDIHKYEKQQQR